jgi:hypothetical protein
MFCCCPFDDLLSVSFCPNRRLYATQAHRLKAGSLLLSMHPVREASLATFRDLSRRRRKAGRYSYALWTRMPKTRKWPPSLFLAKEVFLAASLGQRKKRASRHPYVVQTCRPKAYRLSLPPRPARGITLAASPSRQMKRRPSCLGNTPLHGRTF